MKLKELLKNITVLAIKGSDDVEVTGVNIDSRRIKEGHLFVAMKGTQVDGHKFIPKAVELGAKAVLCEGNSRTLRHMNADLRLPFRRMGRKSGRP